MQRLELAPHKRPDEACSWIEWDLTDPRGRPHRHRFRELFWITAGKGVHALNGKEYPLLPGTLVFVHEDDLHTPRPIPGEHLQCVNLAFELSSWRHLKGRYWRETADPFDAPDHDKHRRLDDDSWKQLEAASEELRSATRDLCALERFLMNLMYLLRSPGPRANLPLPSWLYPAVLALTNPDVHRAGTNAFVEQCGRSREHIARACRKHLGKTPTELICDARLQAAATALMQTDRKVLDIAMASGFSHLGHFYREFRRRYGQTPRHYRLRHQRLIRPV